MFNVRHYGAVIHPDSFSGGWDGFAIRVLNTLRWKLEVLVQRLVIHYYSKRGSMPKTEAGIMTKMFAADVLAEKLQKQQTSPLLIGGTSIPAASRSDRYADGKALTSALETVAGDTMPMRPQPATELIARYCNPKLAKYAVGRKWTLTADETDFEPVTEK